MPQGFVKAARVGELAPGEKKPVLIGKERLLLLHVGGSYCAVADLCTHAYALLSKGQLYGDEIVCPLHGSTFNIRTGAALSPPASQRLTCYEVRVEGHDILVGPARA
jgi:3-phenylpropionate/trans-cinnamate dioxygenase ferredoxin subunit